MATNRKKGFCILVLIFASFVQGTHAGFYFCFLCPTLLKCNRINFSCDFFYKLCTQECSGLITTTPSTTPPTTTPTTTPSTTAPTTTSTTPTISTTTRITTIRQTSPKTTHTTNPTGFSRCGISDVTGPARQFLLISPKIIGGTISTKCEFPWTVFIQISGRSCGGAILDNTHVITATHCVRFMGPLASPESVRVGYGSNDMQELTFLNVTKIIDHSKFSLPTYNNDIAILTLDGSIPYNSCARPLCLPPVTQTFELQNCITVGWGYTRENFGSLQQILRKVTVPIVTTEKCQQIYGLSVITPGQMCAGSVSNGGKDACQGDSGGPMICARGDQWILAGITSTGRGCARVGYPGIYTNVAHFIQWIQERL